MHDLIVSSSGDSNRKNETNQRFFPEYVFNVDFGLGSLERVGIDQSRLAIRHHHYGGAVSSWLDFHPQAPVRVECKDAEISPCFRMVMVVVIGVAFWGTRPSHKASWAPSFFSPILVEAEFVRCSPFQFDR
ncbi:hypothetical protein PJI16_02850 [Nitrospira sp. MA-1]|nr:hypothetical protein [Nitrospira sp. MA-1]